MTSTTTTQNRPIRLTSLLVASTVGLYLLILVGVTNALTDAVSVCSTWPLCTRWDAAVTDPSVALVLGHRLTALGVGLLLVVTTLVAWRRRHERRIRIALGLSLALYPVEMWVGALTAVGQATTLVSAAHLAIAAVIFSGVLASLGWHLDSETLPTESTTLSTESPPSPTGEPARPSSVARDSSVSRNPSASLSRNPSASVSRPSPVSPSLRTRLWAYVRLTKPKLWWLLCLVAVAAMSLAADGLPPVQTGVATLLGGVFAIGASGTFNNVLESDRDEQMSRTDDRPLVTGAIPVRNAVAFGLLLTALSVVIFLVFVNGLAASLGVGAILFYTVVYTLVLKPRTSKSVVLGGAVGAFPALIGWAAVTDTVAIPAAVLGALIFLWTPAHFYNLALLYKEDYARAGFPMLSVIRGEATTRRHILGYLGATMIAAAILGTASELDWVYATVTLVFGAVFLVAVVRLHERRTDRAAFRSFMASNLYLGALLVGVVVDTVAI